MTNLERFRRCFQKAADGEELTLGFFGRSITMGSLASSDETCYAALVTRWWRSEFPDAVIHSVNAGIGGTGSDYGAARVVQDLLVYQPDFVVVDFSVNDVPSALAQETFEGVLRRILGWESSPAVLVLNNVYYDTGANAYAW